MRLWLLCAVILLPSASRGDTVVALRTIRAHEVIGAEALSLDPGRVEGAYANVTEVIGQEARVALYPGRPILFGHVGPPAAVERNQVVELVFEQSGLRITSEGRALGRAAVGERLRVMNLSSRTTLFGTVQPDGSIRVSK